MDNIKKFAVLIDADNTSHTNIAAILEEIAKYGVASVKRVYGDWGVDNLKSWQDKLLPFAITPVQQFAYIKGKDATDMRLVIDAMDLLHTRNLDGFCIVSSDSDFTPLVSRIRENGILAYGFGKKNTSSSFVSACDKFIYVENLVKAKPKKAVLSCESEDEVVDIEQSVLNLIFKAIAEHEDNDGWANLASVGQYISSIKPDFDCRSYKSATLSKLIKKLPVFDVKIKDSATFIKKFDYPMFLNYINGILSKQDKSNRGVDIEFLADKIISDQANNDYQEIIKTDLIRKISSINSKHFEINDKKIKRIIDDDLEHDKSSLFKFFNILKRMHLV